ncbi:MAG: hybrid sensor histidine kinase/response regulator, partial [Planctomycetota bacterium]
MPGMSGEEFLTKARETDPQIVAVVITGHATMRLAVDAMKLGAYDVLAKPFKAEQLRIVARRALEKRRLTLAAIAAERERTWMRDHFVAMVSHQLKSPAASLKECLDAAVASFGGEMPEACRDLVLRASQQSRNLLDLMKDWLTLARMESAVITSAAARVDLAVVVPAAIVVVRERHGAREVGVECCQKGERAVVRGDAAALRELFVNLVDNAIRYTPDGGEVKVVVSAEGAGIIITVADNGAGIALEDLPLIFERFYRGQQAKRTEGTGLGLAIARQITEAHGGHISARSEKGRGTTLKVCLPRAIGNHDVA